jgi:hypothetical protein
MNLGAPSSVFEGGLLGYSCAGYNRHPATRVSALFYLEGNLQKRHHHQPCETQTQKIHSRLGHPPVSPRIIECA